VWWAFRRTEFEQRFNRGGGRATTLTTEELQMDGYTPTQEDADWLCKSQVFCQRVAWATTYNIARCKLLYHRGSRAGAEASAVVAFLTQHYIVSAARVGADPGVLAGALGPGGANKVLISAPIGSCWAFQDRMPRLQNTLLQRK
jgi:hypothetical protein